MNDYFLYEEILFLKYSVPSNYANDVPAALKLFDKRFQ